VLDADGEPIGDAVGQVGRERDGGAIAARGQVRLHAERGLDLAAREHDVAADQIGGRRARARHQHERGRRELPRLAALLLLAVCTAACGRTPIDELDEVYYRFDHRRVVCAISLDSKAGNELDSVYAGLARAKERGELLGLYTHDPGKTVSWDKLEAVLARTDELGLDFVTYPELERADLPERGGLLLSFDDTFVVDWYEGRELFDRYGAKVTFFVSRYDRLKPAQLTQLHQLYDDGHAIEAHSLNHLRASDYVIENGLAAYLHEEVLSELELMQADGFHPTVFAYPFGARTGELDDAILQYFDRVRAVSFSLPELVADPCPE
jgi:hypothetical protein